MLVKGVNNNQDELVPQLPMLNVAAESSQRHLLRTCRVPATHNARSFMCILSSSPSGQPRKVGVVIIYVFKFQRGRAGVSIQPAGPTSVWSLPSRAWHASKWQGEARGECFLKGKSSSTGCRPAVIVELYTSLWFCPFCSERLLAVTLHLASPYQLPLGPFPCVSSRPNLPGPGFMAPGSCFCADHGWCGVTQLNTASLSLDHPSHCWSN